ncbi:hypothetical protein JMA_33110 [Jeotgalibacillus malaysiensis]|uniref:Uncharacterized protein n=1 Tax=Jeotgalibacillus malaysiensis TaxID=1508404 RepID=A0A0B5AVK9_9BACL|nr:hypothetical protein JMA_33110 [Jeotgalibacillus malaysiensis]
MAVISASGGRFPWPGAEPSGFAVIVSPVPSCHRSRRLTLQSQLRINVNGFY